MGLRDLGVGAMISVSGEWVGPQKAQFLSVAEIAPLFPQLHQCHESLTACVRAARAASDPALIEKQTTLDVRHDELVRAAHHLAEGSAAYLRALDPPRTKEAEAILAARDLLLPDGLATVNQSYFDEAGAAVRAKKLMTEEVRAVLEGPAATSDATLLDVFKLYAKVGAELGALEHRKLKEIQTTKAKAAGRSAEGNTLAAARFQWMKVVGVVLQNLELSTAPEETITALRTSIDHLMARGSGSAGERAPEADPGNEPTPTA